MGNRIVVFMINGLYSGGAERIMTWLANKTSREGNDVYFIISEQKKKDVISSGLDSDITLLSLPDMINERTQNKDEKVSPINTLIYKIYKKIRVPLPDKVIHNRFVQLNRKKIQALNCFLKNKPNAVLVAFLDYSIALALLATENLPNKVIISERGDPQKHDLSYNAMYFIKHHYNRANCFVFQSKSAQRYFSEQIQEKSCVIPNPIREQIPEPYHGPREKTIVNFCRISKQKNLPLLVRAFGIFWNNHRDYKLQIIGDSIGADEIVDEIYQLTENLGITKFVSLIPFMENVQESVKAFAMFVSSSDFEGMSNSMLEAMAIGLPCICTDCPSYGAREIISNNENGILVEPGNESQIAEAMCKIADNPEFAEHLSSEATKVKVKLNPDKVFEMWNRLF